MPRKRPTSASLDSLERNSEWFAHQNLSDYGGQWVAIVNQAVVAKDPDLAVVLRAAKRKAGGSVPFITSVPDEPVVV